MANMIAQKKLNFILGDIIGIYTINNVLPVCKCFETCVFCAAVQNDNNKQKTLAMHVCALFLNSCLGESDGGEQPGRSCRFLAAFE